MKLYIYEENRANDIAMESRFFTSIDEANKYAQEQFRWLCKVEKLKDFTIDTGEVVGDFPEGIDIANHDAVWECNGENYDIINCADALHLAPAQEYKVEFIRRTAEQVNGNQPYEAIPNMTEYVTADSAEEAIDLVKQHIIDNCDIVNNDADSITVNNSGEAEEFYGFKAGII